MAFEPLDSDVADFFAKGGELPPSLQDQHDSDIQHTAEVEATKAAEQADVPAGKTVADTSDEPVFDKSDNNPLFERLLNDSNAKLKDLQDKIDALTRAKAEPEEVAPDPAIDPLGALMFEQRRIQKAIADMEAKRENDTLSQNQQSQQERVMKAVNDQISAFEKVHTDYQQAYKHVTNLELHKYKLLGMNEMEARQELGKLEGQIIMKAIQNGKNPAEIVYSMAQKQGFKAAAAEGVKKDPDKTLENIRKGQEASKTLDRATAQQTTELTKSSLGDMSEKELNRVVREDWDSIFGRQKGEI